MFGLFGRGKLKIELPKYNYTPGEVVEGVLKIKLKKPIQANGLFVRLYGEKKTRHYSGGKTRHRTEKIYDFEQPIDGEKEYLDHDLTYKFEIKLPETLDQNTMPEGTMGQVVKAMNVLSNRTTRIKWFVQARLDIPKAIDMRKNVQINV
jgi:hypothetical protein